MSPDELIKSINPATEEVVATFEPHRPDAVDKAVNDAHRAFGHWRSAPIEERAQYLRVLGGKLRAQRDALAELVSIEMGKPISEARGEIDKCAAHCDFFAETGPGFLAAEEVSTSARDSVVHYRPLGCILAIMPWNFPFWQALRFSVPALLAGNAVLLKHASNVPQCALKLESLIAESGFPDGIFRALLLSGSDAEAVVANPKIRAVNLTGSAQTGARIASLAGSHAKKTVLELGGSDPFIVLGDADIDAAAAAAARSRNLNAGQSCIAAKRILVVDDVAETFEERLCQAVTSLRVGDPLDPETQVGPMARPDLRDHLDRQVAESLAMGAIRRTPSRRLPDRGYYYDPTVLTGVTSEMPAFREETFGPVAAVIRVRDVADAIANANDTAYGLGAAIWTRDIDLARELAGQVETGMVYINGIVASDSRVPFGGVKGSGYGRELSHHGIREFVNVQTVWVS